MPRAKKGNNVMSTENTTTTLVQGIAKRRVFDLEKFEKVTKEVKYNIPSPLKTIEEVQALDSEKVLKLVNAGLKRMAMVEAKNSIQGVNLKAVNQMVNTFRLLPPYSGMAEKDSNGEVTKESKKTQTQAIYAFIKSNEAILQMLKDAMTATSTEEEEEEEENEGDQE